MKQDRGDIDVQVQWGSEYLTRVVFEWSIVVLLPIGLVFKSRLNTGLNLVVFRPPFESGTSKSSLLRCFHYGHFVQRNPRGGGGGRIK